MSTIKVNNLQNASGGSNSTPEEIEQGRAKAWVNFNGSGTVSIRDDYGVSSITDNGTGDYTINFSSSLPHSNYCVVTQCTHDTSNTGHPTQAMSIKYDTSPTTSAVRMFTGPTGGANSVGFKINALHAHVAVFA